MIAKKKANAGDTKVILKDDTKKSTAESVNGKRQVLSGRAFDSLKAVDKDALLKALLEHVGWLDSNGVLK